MKCQVRNLLLLAALFASLGRIASQGAAQTFNPLYNFLSITNPSATNASGASPVAGLVAGSNALFGVTLSGGAFGAGSIFQINADGTGFTNLHSFTNGTDGANPSGGLSISGRTLFGTTQYGGGTNGGGTIFRINTDGTGYAILHSFAPNADGAYPASGVAVASGVLYGTANGGGSTGSGTVFRMLTNGTSYIVLHNFNFGADGGSPVGGLATTNGVLYGTTTAAGLSGEGTIFKIGNDGSGFAVLHTFPLRSLGTNSDGAEPAGTLILTGTVLYGTAAGGGTLGFGSLFSLNTDGTLFTNLHNFSSSNGDGALPSGGLTLANNVLYGATSQGGSANDGIVFSMNTNGSGFTALYAFFAISNTSPATNADGARPGAGIVFTNNTLYGVTQFGGSAGTGGIFDVTLHPAFFNGEVALDNGVYYLQFTNGNIFGYYTYAFFPYLYHYDLGFEYFIDANDSAHGAYLYDFTSGHFWYTSPVYPFPYLYDFSLNAVLYYYPNATNAGRYTSNPRYFYNTATSNIFTQ